MIQCNTHALACAFFLLLIAHARGQLTPCNAGYTGRGGSKCSACGVNTYKDSTAQAVEAQMTCGGCGCSNVKGFTGTITDGEGNYKSLQSCWWLIAAEGATISLVFSEFRTEQGYDWVAVYNCKDSSCTSFEHLQSITGTNYDILPDYTGQNYLYVTFDSDYNVEYNGFSAQWYITPGCSACPLYSGHSLLAQTNIASCLCNPGYTGSTGMQCSSCTAGKYKNSFGLTSCTPCSAGTYMNTLAAESCIDCPAGKYINITAATVCNDCSPGSFSTTIKATTNSTCLQCVAGKYASSTGVSVCTNCEASKFSTTVGALSKTVCTQCDSGKYTIAGGSTCYVCGIGKYADLVISDCVDCRAGTFNDKNGNLQCVTCPAGTFSLAAATVCTSCAAGKFSSAEGAASAAYCFDCFSNSFSIQGATSASS